MKDNNITTSYHDELERLKNKEKKKIEKFKKKEERKKRKEEKRLEKIEDMIFAKKNKLSRTSRYIEDKDIKDFYITKTYKISLIMTLIFGIIYFIYSLIKHETSIINYSLFTLIVICFFLTSAIQKKKERKIASIITSILLILWMLLNM